MPRPLAITQDRIVEAYNLAMARQNDTTGEVRDPNLAFSIGYAVCEVFHTSIRSKKPKCLKRHKDAKAAVWAYYQTRLNGKEALAPPLPNLELPTSPEEYFKDQGSFLRPCDHPDFGLKDYEEVPLLEIV